MCQHLYPSLICTFIQRCTSSILVIVFSLAGSMAGKRKNLGSNAKRRSCSSKAGLQFPVAHISRFLKVGKYAKHVGAGALELELAGIAARNDKKSRIIPRHIQLAIRFDDALFLRDVTIPNGGVIPNIHNILLFLTRRKSVDSNAKKRSRSRSNKAGLEFPVARIARFLKVGKYAKRVGAGAPVFLDVVLEYLAAELNFSSSFSFFFY
ncbi:hypothetical protein H5410_026516 [Solanum commersonii]|uniref:Histone H2A n=1 Tax=Solanum commersonii TaxID=4109 RepID=A0A9J5YZ25_SOLCO|nr:hypothetical protein H5410_026516 [Solanum commersonii]